MVLALRQPRGRLGLRPVGFGTDLLGDAYRNRGREFLIRREVFAPVDLLRQATSCNASLLQMDDKLGCIRPGAYADLLVVDGDPLVDIEHLAHDGRDLSLVMRNGEIISNRLLRTTVQQARVFGE